MRSMALTSMPKQREALGQLLRRQMSTSTNSLQPRKRDAHRYSRSRKRMSSARKARMSVMA